MERCRVRQGASLQAQQVANSHIANAHQRIILSSILQSCHSAIVRYTPKVADSCTVLIAAADVLPLLKERARAGDGELLAFADVEALRALEVITKRRPEIVALERLFAATPRGAALINRIKADPSLQQSDIRVVSLETDFSRLSTRTAAPEVKSSSKGKGKTAAAVSAAPLDQRGTRRAPRVKIAGEIGVMVDGNHAVLVDLSAVGAQLVSATILKPNQRVRMSMSDDHGSIRFNAAVAWASFEIPQNSGPRYRAGIEFLDANAAAVDAYAARHRIA
jgi:hypothetical protein